MSGNLFAFRPPSGILFPEVSVPPRISVSKLEHTAFDSVGTGSQGNLAVESMPLPGLSPPMTGGQPLLWPDASTDFDDVPLEFPLRRSVSDGNLASDGASLGVARPPRRKQRGSQASIGSNGSSGSQSRRHRAGRYQHHQYASAPVSPSGSRPQSPVITVSRSSRSSAEVLHDAQRAIIISEESKAAQHAKRDATASVFFSCVRPMQAAPSRELLSIISRYAPVHVAAESMPSAAGESSRSLFGDMLLRLASSVRTASIKSAVVMCEAAGDCTVPHGGSLFSSAATCVAQLQHTEPTCRPMLLVVDLAHPATIKPAVRHSPSALVMSLTQLPAGAAVSPDSPTTTEVHVQWSSSCVVGDAELLAVARTLAVPLGLTFSPDVVFLCLSFSRDVTPAAYARLVRALMVLAHGRLVLSLHVPRSSPHASACAAECMHALQGDDVASVPQADLCCDLETMSLLERIIAPLTPAWPTLASTLSFRLLSEKQFYTLHGDDTVTATVALASLSMSSVREEDEDAMMDGNRKRALSESVTGAAAALLKVVRNSRNTSPSDQ